MAGIWCAENISGLIESLFKLIKSGIEIYQKLGDYFPNKRNNIGLIADFSILSNLLMALINFQKQ